MESEALAVFVLEAIAGVVAYALREAQKSCDAGRLLTGPIPFDDWALGTMFGIDSLGMKAFA